jgi:AraC-like DNA-binding protein
LFALWRAVEEQSDDPALGLRIGVEVLPDRNNVVSLAAMHSATLGEGLHRLARYKRLVCPEKISISAENGEARLRFEWLFAEGEPPTLLTDIIFAGVTNLAQHGTETLVRPRRLELVRRRTHEAILRRHFRCDIRFDAPHDVLVFDEEVLALPMVDRNAQLLASLLPGLDHAIDRDDRALTLADHVRIVLGDTMCEGRPSIAKVARTLGMSARTMQRRLGQLGTSYQDVLDEVRRRSARHFLAETNLAVGEIAFLLGFEEVNSFTRAFQAWEQTTPARWRDDVSGRGSPPQTDVSFDEMGGAPTESRRASLGE